MGDLTIQVLTDMTPEETEILEKYKESGLPGISKIQETVMFQWLELYMGGKTYTEIANITGSQIEHILFISDKSKWTEKKIKHYENLVNNIVDKVSQAKIEGANTVSSMIMALNKYYTRKFNRYLSTNDDSIIENLDSKVLVQYYKSIEIIDKLMISSKNLPPGSDTSAGLPSINLNVGSDAKVTKNEDGSYDITDNTAKELLLGLSKLKKESKSE